MSPIDPREELARSVRSWRVRRFLTQEDLARRARVGRATVARIESGQTVPHFRTILALATALSVAPEELVSDPSRLWGT